LVSYLPVMFNVKLEKKGVMFSLLAVRCWSFSLFPIIGEIQVNLWWIPRSIEAIHASIAQLRSQ
jgi:hypothetical protein